MALQKLFKAVFGDRNDRVLKAYQPTVARIAELGEKIGKLSDEELRAQTDLFRKRLADGESLDDLLPEAFATVREAADRSLGLRPYDVQMVGGIVLHKGMIAEMATGEGKTLVACMPAYLNALSGDGVFIITVNDYLAKRDAEWMSPVYATLGMTVGAIQGNMDPAARQAQYACDITYGTNNEFGFDYLRDNMKTRAEDQVQAKLNYAIIDEVDSILIDEARTPLIISGMPEQSTQLYYRADSVARQLRADEDFEVKEKEHQCILTEDGIEKAQKLAGVDSFYSGENMAWPHHLEQSLRAHNIYTRDKEYVVQVPEGKAEKEIIIVDEFTGRLMPGRRWSDGLHQAVEAKEGLPIREELQTLATITFQNYFRLYNKISGMTGTALTEAEEFHKIYSLDVVAIPTNRPIARLDEEDFVYRTTKEKWNSIVEEIAEVHERGQPVLVGTISIESSEQLSAMLTRRGIPHEVLNAKNHLREAHIVVQAGRKGAVTVATNMAGRGTDIKLGGNAEGLIAEQMRTTPDANLEEVTKKIEAQVAIESREVKDAGGLYVLGTERHESRRIDNQLRGRSGRQGDPGLTRFYLSLEDGLMRIFAREWVSTLLEKLGMVEGQEIQSGMVTRGIEKAQRRVETRNFDIRKNLLDYDEVMDTQRKTIYSQRQFVLEGADLRETVLAMCNDVAESIVRSRVPEDKKLEPDVEGLVTELGTRLTIDGADLPVGEGPDAVLAVVMERIEARYDERAEALGAERMAMVQRFLLLNTIDAKWKDHLRAMDALKSGIGLRGYAQVDPKAEYKREGYEKFELLLAAIAEEVTTLLFRIEIKQEDTQKLDERWENQQAEAPQPARQEPPPVAERPTMRSLQAMQRGKQRAQAVAEQQEKKAQDGAPKPIVNTKKIKRNDPCYCGSGKKFKQCHGK